MGINYTEKGPDGFFSMKPMKTALISSVIRTAKVLEEAAIKVYKEKRNTTRQPSFIINSFDYDLQSATEFKAVAVVQAGGPIAPHFIYVEEPHKLRGGKGMWPGYHVLDTGMEVADQKADGIIAEEFGEKVIGTSPITELTQFNVEEKNRLLSWKGPNK